MKTRERIVEMRGEEREVEKKGVEGRRKGKGNYEEGFVIVGSASGRKDDKRQDMIGEGRKGLKESMVI